MSIYIVILWVVSILFTLIHGDDLPAPRGFLLSCGSTESIEISGLKYIPDKSFISVGNGTSVKTNNTEKLFPILSKVRFFPDKSARKNCYTFQVTEGAKYLVRTTYYYGNFDERKHPPIFDQIIDGTKWSIVNTTEDYAKGLASYYELVVAASSKVLSICLARNQYTDGESNPFISALEVMFLNGSLYKAVDLQKYALSTVARHTFGNDDDNNGDDGANFISYPDDEYNRMWQQYKDQNPTVKCQSNVTSSDFWNKPPSKALSSAITTSRGKNLEIQWPLTSLPGSNYHISLYFQDNRTPSPYSWRVFNILINGETFYTKLNVTTSGVNVFARQWPLSGKTQITLIPDHGVPVGPIMNAAEMFQLLPLGGRTNETDVMAMSDLDRSLNNPPSDWNGDPCLPQQNSWSGVTNLTGLGLTGSLSTSIGNLTAIAHLHLENNQFEGSIPESLADLPRIREIYLQNNKFTGGIPIKLKNRQDITIR
ncbi:hypothetical protein RDABS01_019926 [Bienertia sinuspersici]